MNPFHMKKRTLALAVMLLVGAGCAKAEITSFEECAAAGNPVMESYPRQCRADGQTFVETVAPAPEPVPQPAPEPAPEPQPAPEPAPQPEAATLGKPVTLKVGASAAFADGLKVTLKSIDDSRCPKDVQCVWAGELAAVISAAASGEPAIDLRLGAMIEPKGVAYGYAYALKSITETSATIVVTKQ